MKKLLKRNHPLILAWHRLIGDRRLVHESVADLKHGALKLPPWMGTAAGEAGFRGFYLTRLRNLTSDFPTMHDNERRVISPEARMTGEGVPSPSGRRLG